MEVVLALLALLGAYLLGSLSFAVIVSRAMGLGDPRSYGSGNPGATNVLRSGSRLAAALTLAGDAAKGALGVGLGAWAGSLLVPSQAGALSAGCGLAAFAGHLWPVFFRFRGGKGVATFLGVVAALQPLAGLACCIGWLALAGLTRFASVASMAAAIIGPAALAAWGAPAAITVPVIVMSLLLIWRHRGNLVNLRAGRERRIGERASSS
jgi:glycerol-3-phosphate acyltransferase PlsY